MSMSQSRFARPGRIRTAPVVAVALIVALVTVFGGTAAYAAKKITSKDIKNNSIKSIDIKNGTIQTKDLKNGAISTAKLKNGAVDSAKVKDGSITAADVAPNTFASASALGGSEVSSFSVKLPEGTATTTIATFKTVEVRASCDGAGAPTATLAKAAGAPTLGYTMVRSDTGGANEVDATGSSNLTTVSLRYDASTTTGMANAIVTSGSGVVTLDALLRGSPNFGGEAVCAFAGTFVGR
jgi:hypothetical protein